MDRVGVATLQEAVLEFQLRSSVLPEQLCFFQYTSLVKVSICLEEAGVGFAELDEAAVASTLLPFLQPLQAELRRAEAQTADMKKADSKFFKGKRFRRALATYMGMESFAQDDKPVVDSLFRSVRESTELAVMTQLIAECIREATRQARAATRQSRSIESKQAAKKEWAKVTSALKGLASALPAGEEHRLDLVVTAARKRAWKHRDQAIAAAGPDGPAVLNPTGHLATRALPPSFASLSGALHAGMVPAEGASRAALHILLEACAGAAGVELIGAAPSTASPAAGSASPASGSSASDGAARTRRSGHKRSRREQREGAASPLVLTLDDEEEEEEVEEVAQVVQRKHGAAEKAGDDGGGDEEEEEEDDTRAISALHASMGASGNTSAAAGDISFGNVPSALLDEEGDSAGEEEEAAVAPAPKKQRLSTAEAVEEDDEEEEDEEREEEEADEPMLFDDVEAHPKQPAKSPANNAVAAPTKDLASTEASDSAQAASAGVGMELEGEGEEGSAPASQSLLGATQEELDDVEAEDLFGEEEPPAAQSSPQAVSDGASKRSRRAASGSASKRKRAPSTRKPRKPKPQISLEAAAQIAEGLIDAEESSDEEEQEGGRAVPRAAAAAGAGEADAGDEVVDFEDVGDAPLQPSTAPAGGEAPAKQGILSVRLAPTATPRGKRAVDRRGGFEARWHVPEVDETGRLMTFSLQQTTPKGRKYYLLQLLRPDDPMHRGYMVQTHYGATGTAGTSRATKEARLDDALRRVARMFKAKTGQDLFAWISKGRFVAQPNKFRLVKVDYGSNADEADMPALAAAPAAASAAAAPVQVDQGEKEDISKLSKVQRLVFDAFGSLTGFGAQSGEWRRLLKHLGADPRRSGMPSPTLKGTAPAVRDACWQLGLLVDDLREAESPTGDEVSVTSSDGDSSPLASLQDRIRDRSLQFSKAIRQTGIRLAFPDQEIADLETARRYRDLLWTWVAAAGIPSDIPRAAKLGVPLVDYRYMRSGALLRHVESEAPLADALSSLVASTVDDHAHKFSVDIQDCFIVRRASEGEAFGSLSGVNNRWLLWHGLRAAELPGLLSNGLRPPHAPMRLQPLGPGPHLTDVAGHAIERADVPSEEDGCGGTCLLALCEVAAGNEHAVASPQFMQSLPRGSSCVRSLGRLVPSPNNMAAWPFGDGLADTKPASFRVGPPAYVGHGPLVSASMASAQAPSASCQGLTAAGRHAPFAVDSDSLPVDPARSGDYSEWCVADAAQVRLRYLVRVKLGPPTRDTPLHPRPQPEPEQQQQLAADQGEEGLDDSMMDDVPTSQLL